MSFDALAELRSAGNPVDQLSQAQQQVLSSLSPEEVATLNAVKARMDAAGSDVAGHAFEDDVIGIGIF